MFREAPRRLVEPPNALPVVEADLAALVAEGTALGRARVYPIWDIENEAKHVLWTRRDRERN